MYGSVYPIIGRQTDLPFYLSGIGISEPEYHIRRENGLISHQFLFVKSGEGELSIGGKTIPMKTGCLFYVAPGIPHEYYPLGEEFTTYWLVFRGEYASQLMNTLGFADYVVNKDANTEQLVHIFGMMYAAAKNSVSGNEDCSKLLYEYILAARKLLFADISEKALLGSPVEPAVLWIDNHLSEDITLEQLAQTAGVSLQHFCRLFRARTGMRPMEFIARKRISHAKALLENSDISVAEIGRMTGYENPTYFGMVFRKYEGISPLEYRKRKGTFAI